MTFKELAEEYSERLRLCDPAKRLEEARLIAQEITRLKRKGVPISNDERLRLLDLIEEDADGQPQNIRKAHDMTSFHEAIRIMREQLAQAK